MMRFSVSEGNIRRGRGGEARGKEGERRQHERLVSGWRDDTVRYLL